MTPIANPYKKSATHVAHQGPLVVNMGPQSQQRASLEKRTHKLQAASHRKKRKEGQLTLFGGEAFNSEKHCEICYAKAQRKQGNNLRIPKRAHHARCILNKKTKGVTNQQVQQQREADEALAQHFAAPLKESEKMSSNNVNKDSLGQFFAPRRIVEPKKYPTTNDNKEVTVPPLDELDFCMEVNKKLKDSAFLEKFAASRAPLAMTAFAKVVVEKVINAKKFEHYFDGLTMKVSPSPAMCTSPEYHSIVGQELLLVDWKRSYGVEASCPRCRIGKLQNQRTNFSHNKILFPIFGLNGPPSWCMIMELKCSNCKTNYDSNEGAVICNLPIYMAAAYPVETKYCLGNNSHLAKTATNVFDIIMTTYGNGELCSRLLYNTMNRAYVDKVADYLSRHAVAQDGQDETQSQSPRPYVEKDGGFITYFPPSGEYIRTAYDKSSETYNNHWRISDHERHTREIQGVGCRLSCAEDHTHEVTKNYFGRTRIGAMALWDMGTDTGEIASAVLVPTTKTSDLSHAAIQVTRRSNFKPAAVYSDRWPTKEGYWRTLFGNQVVGRLGLFHFEQRIIRTLRNRHVDYNRALNQLLDCIYYYNQHDYERLLTALKKGTIGGSAHDEEDIAHLKSTKYFRERYGKFLRKQIRPPNVICERLDDWFAQFKVEASAGSSRPALGRKDPITGENLFTQDTKPAVQNCKEKAQYLQDPLPLDRMYSAIPPNPKSAHGLTSYISHRGESSLESFHLMLAHFGNNGMRESLADNINLTGTARHNLAIRHQLRLAKASAVTHENTRRKIPAGWESVVPHFNHSELRYINKLAEASGCQRPFLVVEDLVKDTGEQFFSEYLSWLKATKPKQDKDDLCLCNKCYGNQITEQQQPTPASIAITNYTEKVSNVTAVFTPAAQPPPAAARLPQQQVLIPTVPLLPVWSFYPPPPPALYQTWFCCETYKLYCLKSNKRGRPPHDKDCPSRHKVTML